MTLEITPVYDPKSLSGKDRIAINDKLGIDAIFELKVMLVGTGDASGGYVYADIDLGSVNKDCYWLMTGIKAYSNADQQVHFYTDTDRWEDMHIDGQDNINMGLWAADSLSLFHQNSEALKRPLRLGRTRRADANPGVCRWRWSTNTESMAYNALITFVGCKQPPPHIERFGW